VEQLIEFRKVAFNKAVEENSKKGEEWDENTVTAELDREVLIKIIDLVSSLLKDGKPDLNKIKGENGAKYVYAVTEGTKSRLVSARISTIKDLFDEFGAVLQKMMRNDMADHSWVVGDTNKLKEKAKNWKYESLDPAKILKKEEPVRPTKEINRANALQEACKFLREGFLILTKFRDTWRNLVSFFNDLSILLDVNLTNAIKNFAAKVELANKTQAVLNLIVNQAILVCRAAFQVSVAATTYEQIHQQLLGPNIVKVTTLLGMSDQDEVMKVRDVAYKDCEAATNKMKELTDSCWVPTLSKSLPCWG